METKGNVYCMGIQCPVKNQCLRYTSGIGATMRDGTKDRYMRRCTNQKMYMQDEDNVIKRRK